MAPSISQVFSAIIHKPRYLALLILIPLAGLLYHQWSDNYVQSPRPIKLTGGTTHSPWEGLADLVEDQDELGTWNPGGVGDWLNWKQDKRRALLVTGGAGQLGQSLIPSLVDEYIIHVIDIAPRPTSLPTSVVYHRGSILPSSSALSDLFASTSFNGVIHLAAISLESWCAPKENECHEVNVEGTKQILDQIGDTLTEKRKRLWNRQVKTPWIILGSSMEVYPQEQGVSEVSGKNPTSALGRTKLGAEIALQDAVRNSSLDGFEGEAMINGMILRFPEVYGYPQSQSVPHAFIPSLLTNALTSLPIQFSSDIPSLDLLHVDDAIKGILKAISRIEDQSRLGVRSEGGVEEFNLVYGQRWQTQDIVELVRTEAHSMSPIRDIGSATSPQMPNFSNGRAKDILEWEPEISAPVGLGVALQTLSEDIAEYSRTWHQNHCSPNADFPSEDNVLSDHFVEDLRNKDLTKLDGCTVNLGFDHEGWLHHVKCEDGKHCSADGEKVTAMNWNQSVFIVHKAADYNKKERTVRVMFEEEKGMGYLGYRKTKEDEIGLELFEKDDSEGQIEFDIEVNRHGSFLRLLIPDTGRQIHALSNSTDSSTWFTLEPTTRWIDPHFDMRMNVLCCPSEGDWPLLLDDYESADIRFGSTGQIPFNSSRRLHLCGQAEKAIMHNFDRLSAAKQAVNKVENGQEAHAWESDHGVNTKSEPHSWALKDLPACYNDCNSPAICIQTGDCKCVQADHCQPRRENSILSLNPIASPEISSDTAKSQLGSLAGYSPILLNAVSKTDWRDILLPSAREALRINPDFVKVHVADGYKGQDTIEASDCHKLQTKHCFSADSIMYKALRHMQVPAEEAELIIVPVYQQCKGTEFLLHDAMHHALENIPGTKTGEKTIALVLTHDWGICVAFAWEIWSAREQPLYPDWILDNVLVWSVMGDYDSSCYRSHQDIVIPARTCQSINLKEHFSEVRHIKPIREREHLLTWSGTHWGTGKSDRLRLTCDRGGAGEKELIKGKGPQSNFENWDYMNDLINARFCPQPRGIAGWSPRLNDAIYSGCIPILIAEGTHYPFINFLDWSKFSIRILPTELDRIELILNSIPLWKLEEMQSNLITIREAFIYSTDENPQDELNRKGPLFFALHEASLKIRTKYPVKED
ncbi:uncharacterized protein I206_105303 [Kwoniella pini CBS 10737]|uniref:Exostosin GT47 domain-containing protein n=1 Tax=Kwoniella pini CBS 10737 TaxID=1296096 RepID=A0A1B9I4K8_9TREE|nr:uncharacterized protein I206_03787 [Kwoniella pini CBS 10737]OCF50465.1 hypothetical protein I206_03787 [Kwoniella pini CBS 10737]